MSKEFERRSYDEDISVIKTTLESNTKMLTKIDNSIHGNSHPGMKTIQGKHTTSIKIQWWFIGGISLSILSGAIGIGCYFLRGGL